LAVPVIIDYQISRQPHQPIRQIALFRIVLKERTVNSDEDFLREVLGSLDIRGETVCKIENPSGKRCYYLFPGKAVACVRPAHEFSTIQFRRRLQSFHAILLPTSLVQIRSGRR
jgi:hypothetical protein